MTYLAPSLHYEFSMNITQTQFKGSARYIILVLYNLEECYIANIELQNILFRVFSSSSLSQSIHDKPHVGNVEECKMLL